MAIANPGRRLALHCKPNFVAHLFARGGRRATNASLSLTSMIDFLIVVVVFLLMTFSASAQNAGALDVPAAANASDLVDAPIVSVAGGQVILDGVVVGNTHEIEEAPNLRVLEGLRDALKRKRETWKELHPNRQAPGAVVLQIDQDAPARVVKSVFLTVTRADFPNVSFMVRALPK
jgi:biopolymer transport protein ExbD